MGKGHKCSCLPTLPSRTTGLWSGLPDGSAQGGDRNKVGKSQQWCEATCPCINAHSVKIISPLLSTSCTHMVTIRKLIMENAEVSFPGRHLSAPRYNFIFHIMLPDSAIGSVHSLVPGLYDLSVPFEPHLPRQPCRLRRHAGLGLCPARDSTLTFSMQPHQPAKSSVGGRGGLRQLAPSPKLL